MIENEVFIEKLVVDVFAENQSNPNSLLVAISNAIQREVLGMLEQQLDILAEIYPKIDLFIDHLAIDFKPVDSTNWKSELVGQLTNEIRKSYEEQVILLEYNMESQHLFAQTSPELVTQLIHFYQYGIFKSSETRESLQNLENLIQNDPNWTINVEYIVNFIKNDEKYLRRFLTQHSTSFIQKILKQYFSDDVLEFLMSLIESKNEVHLNTTKIIHYLFNQALVEQALKAENLDSQFNPTSLEFIELLLILEQKQPEIYKKQQKLIQNWVNQSSFSQPDKLSEFIRVKSNPDVYRLIKYLRSDNDLKEKLDSFLQNYFLRTIHSTTVEQWIKDFPKTIQNTAQLRNILMELEDWKPTYSDPKIAPIIKTQINELVEKLEHQLSELENQRTPELTENIDVENAGIILLNPFLPALFKNLELQTENGLWRSQHHQEWAIYLLHYLSTGTFTATEDQLYLAKILTGYPLDEVLNPFENEEENYSETTQMRLKQLDEIEIPNILHAIQENWRPMRNCSWQGLQNDFLIRPGELELKENKHHLLTIKPHALDILLPHIKWGISMLKYSWMGDVLNVEWGD